MICCAPLPTLSLRASSFGLVSVPQTLCDIHGFVDIFCMTEASTEMKCNPCVITAAATDVSGVIDWSRIFTCPLVQTAVRVSVGTYVIVCLQCFGLF